MAANSSQPWGKTAAKAVVVGMCRVVITLMLIMVQTTVTAAGMSHVFWRKAGYATAAMSRRYVRLRVLWAAIMVNVRGCEKPTVFTMGVYR